MNRWMCAAIVAGAVLAGCSGAEKDTPETVQRGVSVRVPDVYTVNYPLAYFAERIGGTAASVVFPVPAGVDPAFWNPAPGVISGYQRADLILLNGAGYAKWLQVASLPEGSLLDTSAGVRDRYLEIQAHVTHTHGPGGEHAHGGIAFTTWLDFTIASAQAAAVYAGIAGVAADTSGLSARYLELAADLDSLDRSMREMANGLRGRALLASHPVYQYLAARYSLDIHSVTWEPDEAPIGAQWAQLAALRAEHPATVMLWEAEPLAATRTRLEGDGIRVVVFDQCGNRPEGGADFLAVMKANIEALEAAAR
jgi:zinc transport system substrate-binding protein